MDLSGHNLGVEIVVKQIRLPKISNVIKRINDILAENGQKDMDAKSLSYFEIFRF